ncbi:MAG: hypothetical protein J7L41_03350, partial [Synergistetes bacterium]|nr:hypothetical protein [Synergistota bacterium]
MSVGTTDVKLKAKGCKVHVRRKVIIKFRASEDVGLGHLYRSLSLAKILVERGCDVACAINDFDLSKEELKGRGIRCLVNTVNSEEKFVDFIIEKERPDVLVFDDKYVYEKRDLLKWKKDTRLVSIDLVGNDYYLFDAVLMPNAHFVDRYPGTLNVLWGLEYVIINEDVRDRKPKVSVPNTVE